MHPLVARFQRCRWSETRKRIDALEVGQSVTLPTTEFNNITTTIQRLQEAYEDTRRWRMKTVAAGLRVERVAPNSL